MNGRLSVLITLISWLRCGECRDEEKILKGTLEHHSAKITEQRYKPSYISGWRTCAACYWPNELYEPCFGGCAEVSCDNPRNHLRPCYPYCEPGCVCEEPYVRDDRTHQCVLPQDCSPTQMGIPVPTKGDRRSDKLGGGAAPPPPPPPPPPAPKPYLRRPEPGGPRMHMKRDDPPDFRPDLIDDLPPPPPQLPPNNYKDDFKRPLETAPKPSSDVSRMGNYFNIVIAPPPIKALQPRKLLGNNFPQMKRLN